MTDRTEPTESAEPAESCEPAGPAEPARSGEPGEPAPPGGPTRQAAGTDGQPAPRGPQPAHRPWPQLRPDDWRNELVHLVDDATTRLQAATVARVLRPARPESRWPVTLTVVVAVALQWLLPASLALPPRWLLPAMEIALSIGLVIANPNRFERHSRPLRTASVALILLISLANAISAGRLVYDIIATHQHIHPIQLLASGAAVWGTNVIAFGLWYWEFDRAGPVSRGLGQSKFPDLLFPQMTVPELTRPGWDTQFVDYLYLSFTNATAFSPTDVMPLARWAKLTMGIQSAVSLAVGALVIARAINIL